MAQDADPIFALGGFSSSKPAVPDPEGIDDLIAEEIAKLPGGHLPRPLRDPADVDRIRTLLIERGYPEALVLERLKEYQGDPGADHDTSDFNTYELLPEKR